MPSIEIRFKDGSVRQFPHQGRAGGSYTKHLSFEHGFAIVTDEWGTRTTFPSIDITEVIETPERPW